MAYALDWLETWKNLEDSEIGTMGEKTIRRKSSIARRFLVIDMFNVLWSLFLIVYQIGESIRSGVYGQILQYAPYFLILSMILIIFLANFIILLPKYSKLKLRIGKATNR